MKSTGDAMFDYITLGTNDLPRAVRFYDAALGPLNLTRLRDDTTEAGYGPAGGNPGFWVNQPFDGRAATSGNGAMPCFSAPTPEAVRAFHAAGLAHGGSDEGAPGLRPYGPGFFAAYLRDPDGNKISAVCHLHAD
jgi:catechol 2,3-dioxygenase-like lactoylglutathione lyase family enzyme